MIKCPLLLSRQFFVNFCLQDIMPFYAVVYRMSKSGAVASDWPTALRWKDSVSNSYAKKFADKSEAEDYIKNMNFDIIDNIQHFLENSSNRGVKRKLEEDGLRKHVQNLHKIFADMETFIAKKSEANGKYLCQIKAISGDTLLKLNKIVDEYENNGEEVEVPTPIKSKMKIQSAGLDLPGYSSGNDMNLIDGTLKPFNFNSNNEVIVYTDGACSNNGKNKAMAGAGVFFCKGHPLNMSKRVPGPQTNNNAEIYSAILAIDQVKSAGVVKVNIHTDSKFLINCVTEWMPKWKKKGWMTSDKNPVKNKDMLESLEEKIKSMAKVSWTHVRGHQGIEGNEEADKLARLGAQE
ncbi:LOW QUALITY PROTEIN: uncharacterized protein LOC126843037 [Adelges cooleyi]|uniref:LOW QUALITY PROTEIN: uncharacterized protein LOC126843037 n=1 Tax=Adelges cooleyi TaxID=133065 RepID=UPI00217F3790|nr:LOW QUALITY PROTEIN: uncharacterized protein LOC126843037 [Adelges cooleyi]